MVTNLKVLKSSMTCGVIKAMLTGNFAIGEINLLDFKKIKENIEKKNKKMKNNSRAYMYSVILKNIKRNIQKKN